MKERVVSHKSNLFRELLSSSPNHSVNYTQNEKNHPVRDLNPTEEPFEAREILSFENFEKKLPFQVLCVSLSPSKAFCAAGGQSKVVFFWSFLESIKEFLLKGHSSWVHSLIFSSNNELLATGSDDKKVLVWSTREKILKFCLTGHKDWLNSLDFSPDNDFLVSGSADKTFKLWNLSDSQVETFFHSSSVNSVCFSPLSRFVASGSSDGMVIIWGTKDRAEIKRFKTSARVNAICFSPEEDFLAVGNNESSVILRKIEDIEREIKLIGHLQKINSLCFSKNGKLLASGSDDCTLRVWDYRKLSFKFLISSRSPVTCAQFSSDNACCILASKLKGVQVYKLEDKKHEFRYFQQKERVLAVSFSFDDKVLATAGADCFIHLWDFRLGSLMCCLEGHSRRVNCLDFSPRREVLASGGFDDTIRIWSVSKKREKFCLSGHSDSVESICFTPNGANLISASCDKSIKVWKMKNKSELYSLKINKDSVNYLHISQSGRYLASGSSDKKVIIWDLNQTKKEERIELFSASIKCLNFSPNDSILAVAAPFSPVVIWDWELDKKALLSKNSVSVCQVQFYLNERYLLTGSYDGTIRLWNAKENTEDFSFSAHANMISSIRVTTDGKFIASGSVDMSSKVWKLKKTLFSVFIEKVKKFEEYRGLVEFFHIAKSPLKFFKNCKRFQEMKDIIRKKLLGTIFESIERIETSEIDDKFFNIAKILVKFSILEIEIFNQDSENIRRLLIEKLQLNRESENILAHPDILLVSFLVKSINSTSLKQLGRIYLYKLTNLKQTVAFFEEIQLNLTLKRELSELSFKEKFYLNKQTFYTETYFKGVYSSIPVLIKQYEINEKIASDLRDSIIKSLVKQAQCHEYLQRTLQSSKNTCEYFGVFNSDLRIGFVSKNQGQILSSFIKERSRVGHYLKKAQMERIINSLLRMLMLMNHQNLYLRRISPDYMLIEQDLDDSRNFRVYFFDLLDIRNNFESLECEKIEDFKSPEEKIMEKTSLNYSLCNVYSLGLVIFTLATLRKVSELKKNAEKHFQDLENRGMKNISSLIQKMIENEPKKRNRIPRLIQRLEISQSEPLEGYSDQNYSDSFSTRTA